MIKNTSYNFTEIQARVDAARHLQDAGQDEDCAAILWNLVVDIASITDIKDVKK